RRRMLIRPPGCARRRCGRFSFLSSSQGRALVEVESECQSDGLWRGQGLEADGDISQMQALVGIAERYDVDTGGRLSGVDADLGTGVPVGVRTGWSRLQFGVEVDGLSGAATGTVEDAQSQVWGAGEFEERVDGVSGSVGDDAQFDGVIADRHRP